MFALVKLGSGEKSGRFAYGGQYISSVSGQPIRTSLPITAADNQWETSTSLMSAAKNIGLLALWEYNS